MDRRLILAGKQRFEVKNVLKMDLFLKNIKVNVKFNNFINPTRGS